MNNYTERMASLSPAKRALLLQKLQEKATKAAATIPRRQDQSSFPLSFAQQRLWLIEQLQPNSALYNIAIPLEIRGVYADLAGMLARCLTTLVQRHEPLRATFTLVDGAPVQSIRTIEQVEIEQIDLRHVAAEGRNQALRTLIQAASDTPFDLGRDLLFRMQLIRTADDEHVLMMVIHHIAFDAWSVGVFVREFEEMFAAEERQAPPPEFPPLTIQYADFAAWQREWLQGPVLEQQLSYWKEQLQGDLPTLALPTDRPRPPVQTFNGGRYAFWLPDEVASAARTLSQQQNVTLFMTLLSAWAALLQRYSGQDDIIVGSPIANRNRRELEDLIGFFVNTLVMRVKAQGDPTFLALLEQVRDVALGAFGHQDLPFEMLVDAVQPTRDLSRSPLFQVLFVLQNAPMGGHHDGIDVLENPTSPAKFDITFSIIEFPAGLQGVLEYNTDLFDADTIERMAAHYTTLLGHACAAPTTRLSALSLLDAAEEREVRAWSTGPVQLPTETNFLRLFESQVADSALHTAIESADERITYAELNDRANTLADHLRQHHNIGPESLVGICAERSVAMVVAVLAVLKAGAGYVPLDPAYPAERLAWMVEDSKLRLILAQSAVLPLVKALAAPNVDLLDLDTVRDGPALGPQEERALRPENIAYVIYTSGSTGRPKGVMVPHAGLSNLIACQSAGFGITATSKVLQFASFSFDAAVSEIGTALASGATLVLMPPGGVAGGADVLEVIRRHNVTKATLPPSLLAVLDADQTPSLGTVVAAGEAASADVVRRWGAGRRFINAYGPTEASVCATMGEIAEPDGPPPIGTPLANTQAYVLDRHGNLAPTGIVGEIALGGVGLARGYLGRPELTAERFVPNPFAGSGERLYRTGDLGRYRRDGRIEFVGRMDQQVKVRGHRIELGEVTAVLNDHPAVEQSCVLVQDQGTATARLAAYVVPSEERAGPVRRLLALLADGRLRREQVSELECGATFVTDGRDIQAEYQQVFESGAYRAEICAVPAGGVVIDIGAGSGLFALRAAQAQPGVRVIACEADPSAVALLRQNLAIHAPDSVAITARIGAGAAKSVGGGVAQQQTLSALLEDQGLTSIDMVRIAEAEDHQAVVAGIDVGDWPRIKRLLIALGDHAEVPALTGQLARYGYEVAVTAGYDRAAPGRTMVCASRPEALAPGRSAAIIHSLERFERELTTHAQSRLPAYAVPGVWVGLADFPLTPNGKIDQRALAAITPAAVQRVADYVAPQSELERRITAIWQAVLGLERVGINDNFFDIGGNSLAMVQVHSQLKGLGSSDIAMLELFKYPTIQSLATFLARGAGETPSQFADQEDRAQKQRNAFQRQRRRR